MTLLSVVSAFSAFAETANLNFASTQNALSVAVGSALTITTDRPVTWSLAPGSLGSITATSSTSAVYTPPASGVQAQNSIGGCLVLPNDSVFNTPIRKLPVHTSSSAWTAQSLGIGAVGISFQEAWGLNLIDNSLAPVAATFYYSSLLDGTPFQFAPKPARKRETGSLTLDGVNDHHMVSLNHQTCQFYESYQDGLGAGGTDAQSGYTYSSLSYTQPSSADGGGTTDAAGLPLMPLTLHLSEIESGAVHHALRFSSCAGCISNQFLWPAISSTGAVYSSAAAPMGSRWRLKSSFDVSSFSAKAQVILRALQDYGMILADIGLINQIETSSDLSLDPAVVSALNEITSSKILASELEVVDESGLQVSPTLHEVKRMDAVNYAVVRAKDENGKWLWVRVAIQPILVGTPFESMLFQAGQPIQLQSWVNGTANQNVTWVASTGSVTAGVYTPPSFVSSPVAVTLTATAAADSTATTSIRGWVIPAGSISIDVGATEPYTDANGTTWLADTLGFESGSFSQQNDNYPSNAWGNSTNATVYQTYNYTWGDDITYGPFVVPNGTYSITFLFGRGECSGIFDPTALNDNNLNAGPVALEANGVDTMFYPAVAEDDTCRIPTGSTIQSVVTNNLLTIALRSTGNTTSQTAPELNGLSITPLSQ